jgi:hypothetical protein
MARRLPRGQYIVGLLGAPRTEVSVNNKFDKTAYDLGHPRNMKSRKADGLSLNTKNAAGRQCLREMAAEEKTTARSCKAYWPVVGPTGVKFSFGSADTFADRPPLRVPILSSTGDVCPNPEAPGSPVRRMPYYKPQDEDIGYAFCSKTRHSPQSAHPES